MTGETKDRRPRLRDARRSLIEFVVAARPLAVVVGHIRGTFFYSRKYATTASYVNDRGWDGVRLRDIAATGLSSHCANEHAWFV